MADTTVHNARTTYSPAVSGLFTATNFTHGAGTPIPVHIPLGNNVFLYVGDLPPSRGTGVFIPKVHEIPQGGANDRGGGGGGRATHFGCEIDEEEGAQLIGIELYKHINFNA